jgi:Xaa-Pro aminopeptidase
MSVINSQLANFRHHMKLNHIDAYIIPSTDPHQSEYIADCWKDREWISGFTGSAGTVVITHTHAGLWTDSRYFLQGEIEIQNTEFQLHKLVHQFEPEYIDFIIDYLPEGSKVGLDAYDFSKATIDIFSKKLNQKNISLILDHDLVSEIWTDRPGYPSNKVFEHEESYVGLTRKQKINAAQTFLSDHSADYLLLSMLDEIAYLLNLRGSDVKYNPVCVSYVVVEKDKTHFFVDSKKLDHNIIAMLLNDNIHVHPYHYIIQFLNELDQNKLMIVDKNVINGKLFNAINAQTEHEPSPVRIAKGIKEEKEISFYKSCMIDDGASLAKAFYKLEQIVGKQEISEYGFAKIIAEARSTVKDYHGESFSAIIGYESNGAMMHYNPDENNSAMLKKEGVLLVDCGGQYKRGTTDITRTIALGRVTEEVKKHYTLVLKGHLALSAIKFPIGTSGTQLEAVARQFMWNEGLNYLHGTGHGVGYFLNVHEGPFGFAPPIVERGRVPFAKGMVITNEPGIYITGSHGIRIENIMVIVESAHENFLEFESITLYPYDLDMINEYMLTSSEKSWINNYHKKVYELISPQLSEEQREWFYYKCKMFG